MLAAALREVSKKLTLAASADIAASSIYLLVFTLGLERDSNTLIKRSCSPANPCWLGREVSLRILALRHLILLTSC